MTVFVERWTKVFQAGSARPHVSGSRVTTCSAASSLLYLSPRLTPCRRGVAHSRVSTVEKRYGRAPRSEKQPFTVTVGVWDPNSFHWKRRHTQPEAEVGLFVHSSKRAVPEALALTERTGLEACSDTARIDKCEFALRVT